MKTIKTEELAGAALDWAVAKCEIGKPIGSFLDDVVAHPRYNNFHPSTNWEQCGPIIERERISVTYRSDYNIWVATIWPEHFDPVVKISGSNGPTPLMAAMRCFVASKLGDEVGIPDELQLSS